MGDGEVINALAGAGFVAVAMATWLAFNYGRWSIGKIFAWCFLGLAVVAGIASAFHIWAGNPGSNIGLGLMGMAFLVLGMLALRSYGFFQVPGRSGLQVR